MRSFSKLILVVAVLLSWIGLYIIHSATNNRFQYIEENVRVLDSIKRVNDSIKIATQEKVYKIDSVHKELVKEVGAYIEANSNNSKVNPKVIVDNVIRHNFDIFLLMAQAQLEGHFATVGRPKTTGSIFGVGLYDNGVNARTFKDPNHSIEPYILLVKKKYLGKHRTVDQLLANGYKTLGGLKYASAPNYAERVKALRKKIKRETNIEPLLSEYKTLIS